MDANTTDRKKTPRYLEIYKLGYLLVGSGVLILIDQEIKTGWLTISIPAIAGFVITIYGILRKHIGWITGGTLLLALGSALVTMMNVQTSRSVVERAGNAFIVFAAGWFVLFALVSLIKKQTPWWALVLTAVFMGAGIFFKYTPNAGIFPFVVLLSAFLGTSLLIWGVGKRLLGLVISGCVVLSLSPAFYYSWMSHPTGSSLINTGTMLVWLALGWFMVSLISRIVFQKYIWWPIIPCGVLAMVGWGLYIGGSAGKELGFISNTGSVALILFGLYLILLKYGLRK